MLVRQYYMCFIKNGPVSLVCFDFLAQLQTLIFLAGSVVSMSVRLFDGLVRVIRSMRVYISSLLHFMIISYLD